MDSLRLHEGSFASELVRLRVASANIGRVPPPGFDAGREFDDLVFGGLKRMGTVDVSERTYAGKEEVEKANPRLDEASRFSSAYVALDKEIQTARLKPLATAFEANLDRVRSMASFLYVIAFWADQMAAMQCLARHRIGVSPDDTSKDGVPEMGVALETIYDEFVARRAELTAEGADRDTFTKGSLALDPVIGVAFANYGPLDKSQFPVAKGVESIFGSMVSLAYAAFEAVAADLWVEAVNQDVGLAKRWFGAKANQNANKKYDVSELLEYDFTFVGKAGTWLKKTDKAKFNCMKDLRSAYESAFGSAVLSCFDDSLDVTEQVRHSLAHRGGVVDSRFLGAIKGHAVYGNLPIGKRLPLRGELVRDHVSSCVDSFVLLVRFVDSHLKGLAADVEA